MNVLFRADSSSMIGTGHIMRDLVLASEYRDAKIIFSTQNLDGNINHKIIEAGYEIVLLKSNDIREVIKLVQNREITLVIIDNYTIDYFYEKELKEKTNVEILVFDDTYEKHYCDILLNHNISADRKKYKELVPQNCKLRCGSKYTLLRKEFYQEKEIKRIKIYDVFIAMGGADTANINIKILRTLPKKLKQVVVTTTANKNIEELKNYVKDKENITLWIDSKEIAKILNQSILAIVTPSVTVNEIYFMNMDFVAIKTADNQEDMYNYLLKNGYKVLEKLDTKKLKDLL